MNVECLFVHESHKFFLFVDEHTLDIASKELKKLKDFMKQDKIAGICFVDTDEKYRISSAEK